MNWKKVLQDTDWQGGPGATPADIAALVAASEAVLPDDYLSFLRFSNGGQSALSVHPLWLMLYDAALVVKLQSYPNLIDYFPGLFIIGSNGAGESIAFDFRPGEPFGIVYFDSVNPDLKESVVPLAASFAQLMTQLE